MNDLQQQVQEAIDQFVESGAERGLQVAVYQHGELMVDAFAGVADPETERRVVSDTPFYAYSTGKGATATVAHMLGSHRVGVISVTMSDATSLDSRAFTSYHTMLVTSASSRVLCVWASTLNASPTLTHFVTSDPTRCSVFVSRFRVQ